MKRLLLRLDDYLWRRDERMAAIRLLRLRANTLRDQIAAIEDDPTLAMLERLWRTPTVKR